MTYKMSLSLEHTRNNDFIHLKEKLKIVKQKVYTEKKCFVHLTKNFIKYIP